MAIQPVFLIFAASLLVIGICLLILTLRFLWVRCRKVADGPRNSAEGFPLFLLVSLIIFGLMLAGFYILRFEGRWAENDTCVLTTAIIAVMKTAGLTPEQGYYMHGLGYQAVAMALAFFTGLSAPDLQIHLFPYLGVLALILTSNAFFRAVTRNRIIAVLGSIMVLFQPDMLFVTLRGSHEKLTWPLMMIALTIFFYSVGKPPRKMAVYVVLFYFVVFSMICTNMFFGSVFLFAILLSMILGLLILQTGRFQIAPLPKKDIQRLMYISLSGGMLVFIFMAYLYPPALSNFLQFPAIIDQISALLLSFEIGALPYAYISFGWISTQVYFLLTVFTWSLVAVSLLEWLRRVRQLYRGTGRQGLVENIDWLLYTGFVVQIAISIVIDFSGWLSANLQLRLFPGFSVIAVCLLVRRLQEIMASPGWTERIQRWATAAALPAAAWFTAATILKASNEPLLSNKWSFYTDSEFQSIQWVESRVTDAPIYSGFDERMADLFRLFFFSDSTSNNVFYRGDFTSDTRFIVYSVNDRNREIRLKIDPLPVETWELVYDNGDVQIFHLTFFGDGRTT